MGEETPTKPSHRMRQNLAQTVLQAEVRGRFDYDPESGVFREKATGKLVGTLTPDGYLVTSFKGKTIGLHRLAFAWMLGSYPPKMTDHINGNRSDNRWCNLRPANPRQNAQNRGPTGKCVWKGAKLGADGRWRAHIMIDGVRKNVPGTFDSAEQAHNAYKHYAGRFFGQFARLTAPHTGVAPAQDDVLTARAQLEVMKRRRADIAQQLADLDTAIAALEPKVEKAEARQGFRINQHHKMPEPPAEEVKKPLPIKPLGTVELMGLERLKALNEKHPLQQ